MKNLSMKTNIIDWLNNEGKASGDFENFLWSCRPENQSEAKSLVVEDRQALAMFNPDELNRAISELEAANGFEDSSG